MVGGHQRLKVLTDMGITEVDVVVVDMDTEKEKAPWAMVMLRGPSEVKGVVIENNCGAQNRHRQVPLELQVSEDGENWKTVHRDTEVRDTYRIDLRTESPRARYVRVRRMPDAKEDVYHFGKFLVYGKKLY